MSDQEPIEQTEPKANHIMFVRMSNGDEVLGRLYETDDSEIVCLKNPLLVERSDSENGYNLHLNKWIPYSDDIFFPVNRNTIMTHSRVTDNIEKFYRVTLDKLREEDEEKVETIKITDDMRQKYLSRNIILH